MDMHDLRLPAGIEDAVRAIEVDALEMSDLTLKAHEIEDIPGGPVEDPRVIGELLGL